LGRFQNPPNLDWHVKPPGQLRIFSNRKLQEEPRAAMTNVSVGSSIVTFREPGPSTDDTNEISCPEYLWRREMAERAAAKNSSTQVARRIHQQLAEVYAARRRFSGGSSDES
jgi:hypothetical protein